MDEYPKISVITTVYNGIPYIEEAVDSILNQTFKNWEYIIINDGSNDSSASYLDSINESRIKIFHSEKIGRGNALNFAISNCSAEYVAILDADDISLPYRLELQSKVLDANLNLAMIFSYSLASETLSYSEEQAQDVINFKTIDPSTLIKRSNLVHSSVMMRKSELIDLGLYNSRRTNLFDLDLWIRAATENKKMAIIPKTLVFKRTHANQFFEKRKRLKYLFDTMILRYKAAYFFKSSFVDFFIPLIGFFYGMIPSFIRVKLHNRNND